MANFDFHLKSGGVHSQETEMKPSVDVPVVIIGGGPTGLLQAHLLSKLGGSLVRSLR